MQCVQGVTKSATDYLHISMKKRATNFFIIPLCLAAVYLDVFLRRKLIIQKKYILTKYKVVPYHKLNGVTNIKTV